MKVTYTECFEVTRTYTIDIDVEEYLESIHYTTPSKGSLKDFIIDHWYNSESNLEGDDEDFIENSLEGYEPILEKCNEIISERNAR